MDQQENALPPQLVWPPLLQLPPAGLKVVYLDLNHWISLAQASTGHRSGAVFLDTLQACRAAKADGTAVFVLSSTHYFEMMKIKDPSQRRELADIMEELSTFATLVNRWVVMELELAAVLDRFATKPSQLPRTPLIGRGVRHGLGLQTGLRIMGPSGDETERVRNRMGAKAFDDFVVGAELSLDRSALRGPTDDEVSELRAYGWNPEAVIGLAEKRAVQEREQSHRLDGEGTWRRGRLRDVMCARELMIEFQEILPRALAERDMTLEDAMTRADARVFVRAMPSTEVSLELKTAWHRNRDKAWTSNDIQDIDAMSLAVPYCDIVATDKACHHALTAAGLGQRMHTELLRRLDQLPEALATWEPTRLSRR